jgi:DNA (cytosine-5)-methyltransferase 1
MKLRYLSLCSGMEGAALAWEPLGWECVAVAEIDKDACKLLKHRLPHVPNLGDLTKIEPFDIECLGHIDVVIFGAPCQSVSNAGKREGFFHEDGTPTRSGLFHDCLKIARWSGARFVLYENVEGLFSSSKGRDFAGVVADMVGAGHIETPQNGWGREGAAVGDSGHLLEWTVCDSQRFGLAQRRKRVFALLDTGDWYNRPPILLISESLRRSPSQSGEAREEDAGGVEEGAGSGECGRPINIFGGNKRKDRPEGGFYVEMDAAGSKTLDAASGLNPSCSQGGTAVMCFPLHPHAIGRKDEAGPQAKHWSEDDIGYTMDTKSPQAVAYSIDDNHTSGTEIFGTMQARKGSGGSWMSVCQNYVVRRLLPTEAERLQGVQDGYTLVPGVSETARYKLLGNGFSVPVIRWIGERIEMALQFKAG